MQCVFQPREEIKAFIGANIPRCAERGLPPKGSAIGVVKGDELIGGFFYHDYDPDAGVIEISGASTDKGWLTRLVLFTLFSYPFLDLGCQMVAMRHSANDKPLARMLRAYGFKQVVIPRLFGRHEDAIVSTLTVEDWLNNGFHKRQMQ